MSPKPTAKSQTVKSQNVRLAVTFAARVERARKVRGWTKQRLEDEAGLAKGYVSRITRGQQGVIRPSAGTVASLARALGVSEAWLFAGEGAGPDAHEEAPPPHATPRRPNLERAAAVLRAEGMISAAVVRRVSEATEQLGDLDFATWIHVLMDIHRGR